MFTAHKQKERIFERTVTEKFTEKPIIFTTEPKKWRSKNRGSLSGKRWRDFMKYLWQIGFRDMCHYKGLVIQFIQCFERNDPRVIDKYRGRPEDTIYYPSFTVTKSDGEGWSKRYTFSTDRKIAAKQGLMEILGYITLNKETGQVVIHHECMSYYTKQATFNEVDPPRHPPLRSNERLGSSKQDFCVCCIEAGESKRQHGSGEVGEKKEEEEVVRHTHKRGLEKIRTHGLTDEGSEFLEKLEATVSQKKRGNKQQRFTQKFL